MLLLTSSMKQNIVLSIYHLVTQIWRQNTQKYSLGESILLAKTIEYTLMYNVYTRQVSGRLNDKIFSHVGVWYILKYG